MEIFDSVADLPSNLMVRIEANGRVKKRSRGTMTGMDENHSEQ